MTDSQDLGGTRTTGAWVLPDDLVQEIAASLEERGEYRVALDSGDPQRLVDLRWAALSAGRRLHRDVRVHVTRASVTRDIPVSVLVTWDRRRPVVPRQRGV